ncbi:uncharacterized protein JCM15063_006002 [Sporobolomyces koalae]|uniref:uncharacterized protein n=1 Tax=Sporobolomyces koalae TaxID=500713 RepID=UPI0031770B27
MTASHSSSVTRSNSNEKPMKAPSASSSTSHLTSRDGADLEKQPVDLPTTKDFESKKEAQDVRRRWWLPAPRDPFPSLAEAPITPYASANWFSQLTFHWMQPMLNTGYQRTLVPTDLWKLNENFEAGHLSDLLLSNFEKRRAKVEAWNKALEDGSFKPGPVRKIWWKVRKTDGKRKVGLALALSDTFFYRFWLAGVLKIISDGLNVTSPLVTRALITYGTGVYLAHRNVPGYTAQPIGVGIGLAFGLWGMQIVASFCLHHFFANSAGVGVLCRSALIASIYKKATTLSGKAKTTISNGRLTNHIGTDVSRIDFCAGFFHMSWTAPIQIIVILIILLIQIGPSCLVGIGFLFIMIPPQSIAMKKMFGFRRKAMVWTDKRARLIQELLGGMKVIKFFAWEIPYLKKLQGYRAKEMKQVRNLLISRAATTGVAMSLPTLATVLAFVTYAGTGHQQDAANIFTSFTLFQLLRMPLMMLPMSLSTITDAHNALGRLTEVFLAEERENTFKIDPTAKEAVRVVDADFKWESPPPDEGGPKTKKQQKALAATKKGEAKKAKKEAKAAKKAAKLELKLDENAPIDAQTAEQSGDATGEISGPNTAAATASPIEKEEKELMQLRGINLKIPKGQLCAVVGAVGSGKSSLLQALVGEMKRTKGEIAFGGSIAYAAQQAWMQSCSLRDNILFGRAYDEAKYKRVIQDACLEADIEMLPYGDQTDIGEKGVTLSGGQKQRVNIARTLYYDADIVLLDDPLSAVDAHVGKHLFDNAICGSLAHKTRILVTHALHFLPRCDYIICLENGKISQEGTYAELVSDRDGAFSALMEEFGGDLEEKKEEEEAKEEEAIEEAGSKGKKATDKPVAKALMQEEERATGSVDRRVYLRIFKLARGCITFTLLVAAVVLQQAAQVVGSYFLVWWQDDQFNKPSGFYEGMYALLGVLQAVFSFVMGLATSWIGWEVSRAIHAGAIQGILHAPMSFFDTTPLGRITNRFSKDIDTIDNVLTDSFRMFVSTLGSVLGSIVLIAIVQQWFLLVVAAILCLYAFAASFYRQSARELKRLDNLLRSSLYAHFSESLSGLPTVRAYGEIPKFVKQNQEFLDIENRAYYLTVINQRWLGLRLDFFGSCLTFAVAMFSVGTAKNVSPSQTGLILSYILTISQAFSWMVRQGAEVENDMNSVERLFSYFPPSLSATSTLPSEAPAVIEDSKLPAEWPHAGAIEFKKVFMSYRPDLPPVLKGLSLTVGAGERIGVVGRTGAGKSSLMTLLFRIVEVTSGEITIDGVDISKIGLADLRSRLSIIPQDAVLFNGTLRTNLDPFEEHDDATLHDALKRAWLIDRDSAPAPAPQDKADSGASTPSSKPRFTLDLQIEDEGSNLSVGERSLVSLARALVKDSKIIILDEATASVDFATDSRIQETIRTEFKHKTLLIIAHRLRTVIDADRILVMDQGQVAEFDRPLNLFRQGGIFHSMCERSGISASDIRESSF